MNTITFLGNLGADPVLRTTQNGSRVCNLRVAVNEGDYVNWYNVTAWNDSAVAMSKAKKGDQVFVSGRLETSTWDREVTSPKGETFTIKTDSYTIKAQNIFLTSDINAGIVNDMPEDTVPELSHAN